MCILLRQCPEGSLALFKDGFQFRRHTTKNVNTFWSSLPAAHTSSDMAANAGEFEWKNPRIVSKGLIEQPPALKLTKNEALTRLPSNLLLQKNSNHGVLLDPSNRERGESYRCAVIVREGHLSLYNTTGQLVQLSLNANDESLMLREIEPGLSSANWSGDSNPSHPLKTHQRQLRLLLYVFTYPWISRLLSRTRAVRKSLRRQNPPWWRIYIVLDDPSLRERRARSDGPFEQTLATQSIASRSVRTAEPDDLRSKCR